MNSADILHPDEKETVDFPTTITITIISHLMTLYALKPCEPLATRICRHIKVMLNSPATDSLGQWKERYRQILAHWC